MRSGPNVHSEVDQVKWYHRIDLGNGMVTPGLVQGLTLDQLRLRASGPTRPRPSGRLAGHTAATADLRCAEAEEGCGRISELPKTWLMVPIALGH
jgi:hypothetical protein